jgi:hypothetical protein
VSCAPASILTAVGADTKSRNSIGATATHEIISAHPSKASYLSNWSSTRNSVAASGRIMGLRLVDRAKVVFNQMDGADWRWIEH